MPCAHCGNKLLTGVVTTEDNESICEACATKARDAAYDPGAFRHIEKEATKIVAQITAQIIAVEGIDGASEFEDADTVLDPDDVKPEHTVGCATCSAKIDLDNDTYVIAPDAGYMCQDCAKQ